MTIQPWFYEGFFDYNTPGQPFFHGVPRLVMHRIQFAITGESRVWMFIQLMEAKSLALPP